MPWVRACDENENGQTETRLLPRKKKNKNNFNKKRVLLFCQSVFSEAVFCPPLFRFSRGSHSIIVLLLSRGRVERRGGVPLYSLLFLLFTLGPISWVGLKNTNDDQ